MIDTNDIRQRLSQNTAIDAKEIQALCDEVEWIDVNERLPECNTAKWSEPVIALSDNGNIYKLSVFGGEWQRTADFIRDGAKKVTHWIPLPKHKTK